MSKPVMKPAGRRPPGPGLFSLLTPYRKLVVVLVVITIAGNSLNLVVPRLMARAIDTYNQQRLILSTLAAEFFAVAAGIFLFSYLQTIVQTYASERVARDLRTR